MSAARTPSLVDVLACVSSGAGSAGLIAARLGTSRDLAEAALAALASTGRIRRVLVFAGGCATDGCGGCSSAVGCASAGVGSQVGSGITAWQVVTR